MRICDGSIIMDDGTKYYASGGIIGLCSDGGITQGYDDNLGMVRDLPPEHRKEIAKFMIEQWNKILEG
jgi:hypothetical protein